MKILSIIVIISLLCTPVVGILIGENLLNNGDGFNSHCEPEDETPPESFIKSTPTFVLWPENIYSRPTITLTWQGVDDPEGCGIKCYDVQYIKYYIGDDYHTIEIPYWSDWVVNTTNISAQFIAKLDYVYYFRVRATDNAGNVEDWSLHHATTIVKGVSEPVCEVISERIYDRIKESTIPEHYLYKGGIIPPIEDDDTPPVSRVEPLFPLHFWITPRCWIMDLDTVSIQVYPYPPAYYAFEWLEEQGIISDDYGGASVPISWHGVDPDFGTGIEYYDVQYQNPHIEGLSIAPDYPSGEVPTFEKEWTDIITNTTGNNTIFYTSFAGFHQFRCRAVDYAGNIEDYPVTADTSILIIDLRTLDTY